MEVSVYNRKQKSGAFEGEIVSILERNKTQFVGVLQIEKNYAFVLTRGPRMYTDFFIDKKYSLIAKQQQWILCSADDIIWIVGDRIDDRFKITTQTKNVYIAEILKDK